MTDLQAAIVDPRDIDSDVPLDPRPITLFLSRFSRGASRRTMESALERVASLASGARLPAVDFPWYRLEARHTRRIRDRLAERYAPAGANLRLCALRGVLRECCRLGLLDSETFHAAADLPPVRGGPTRTKSLPSPTELEDLFTVCMADPSAAGARDRAVIGLLYGTGLNRTQAASLDLEDYRRGNGALRIRRGQQFRYRPLDEPVRLSLEAWLVYRGEEAGPLLTPVHSSGKVVLRRITPQALLLAYRKRAKQSATPGAHVRTQTPSLVRPAIQYRGPHTLQREEAPSPSPPPRATLSPTSRPRS